MTKYTNREVAEKFELWGEYFDPNAEITRDEFDAMTVDEREKMIEGAFGTDAEQSEMASK
jgi:hypothetical protein